MIEIIGKDLFDQISKADAIVITTNCSTNNDGTNPMGAMAGEAARHWTDLPAIYGRMLFLTIEVPVVLGWVEKENQSNFISSFEFPLETIQDLNFSLDNWCAIVAFPTMFEIGEPAHFDLVKRNAEFLVHMADMFEWEDVYGGRPGCGVGGLDYESEVKPMLESIFDDRFYVMHK